MDELTVLLQECVGDPENERLRNILLDWLDDHENPDLARRLAARSPGVDHTSRFFWWCDEKQILPATARLWPREFDRLPVGTSKGARISFYPNRAEALCALLVALVGLTPAA